MTDIERDRFTGKLLPCYDRNHPKNAPRYRTGKACIVEGCGGPAGTWWSALWCFAHNAARMRKIDVTLYEAEVSLRGR